MGFDINVMMEMFMCPASGKPFYYRRNPETKTIEKCYEIPDITVPVKMCEYLVGRGPIFYAYTQQFNEQERYNISADEFLEEYPSWETIVDSEYYNDEGCWIQEDHKGFKRLLEWCTEQDVPFRVCWSY
jgi:hypothetical protein